MHSRLSMLILTFISVIISSAIIAEETEDIKENIQLHYDNEVHAHFEGLMYHDLDLKFKNYFAFMAVEGVKDHFDCLSGCKSQPDCMYSYYLDEVCYLCRESAGDYLIDNRPPQIQGSAKGQLFRRHK